MPAIGWKWVGGIVLYAVAWFLFNDFLKLGVYRLLDRATFKADGDALEMDDELDGQSVRGRVVPMSAAH